MYKRLMLFFTLLLIAACATAPLDTRSGRPEVTIVGAQPDDVQVLLAQACVRRGWRVAAQSASEVQCQVPLNSTQSVFYQAMIGNSYSTPPNAMVRFSVVQMPDGVFVQAIPTVSTQMAFGQMRAVESRNNSTLLSLQNLLEYVESRVRQASNSTPPTAQGSIATQPTEKE